MRRAEEDGPPRLPDQLAFSLPCCAAAGCCVLGGVHCWLRGWLRGCWPASGGARGRAGVEKALPAKSDRLSAKRPPPNSMPNLLRSGLGSASGMGRPAAGPGGGGGGEAICAAKSGEHGGPPC